MFFIIFDLDLQIFSGRVWCREDGRLAEQEDPFVRISDRIRVLFSNDPKFAIVDEKSWSPIPLGHEENG